MAYLNTIQSHNDELRDILDDVNALPSGVAMNFRVIGGTSQPSSPKENDIWVNTSTAITSWVFSSTQPSNPTNGMVWFSTGTSSTVAFNALKENEIQLYPVLAKQYVSGAWNDVAAKSYRDGAFVAWRIGYVFRDGQYGRGTV